jgi:predicted ATPase
MSQLGMGGSYPWSAAMSGVVLRRWRLKNFKSVREAETNLYPLTLLVGANSAGKSSLIQSILAANQAIGALGDLYPFNGSTVRLGMVEEVKHRGPESAESDRIAIGAEFAIQPRGRFTRPMTARMHRMLAFGDKPLSVAWSLELGSAPTQQSGRAQIERLQVALKRATPVNPRRDAGDVNERSMLDVTAQHVDAAAAASVEDPTKERVPLVFGGTYVAESDSAETVVHVPLRGGFPQQAYVLRDRAYFLVSAWLRAVQHRMGLGEEDEERTQSDEATLVARVVEDLKAANSAHEAADLDFEAAVRSELSDIFAAQDEVPVDLNLIFSAPFQNAVLSELASAGIKGEVPVQHSLDQLGAAASMVSDFLRDNIRYLGPLREDPRVVYQDSPETGNGYVGPKGEFCAAVLQRSGTMRVHVPLPGRPDQARTTTLSAAVNLWAQHLDIGERFSATDEGRFGLQMQVQQSDVAIPLDLTSVGTGVSQLLPVLVMCLQAPVGTLLMMEQPELHLNPRVQQRLADFLLAIARSGRHLIVETHSEYLISRLRLRMAEDSSDAVRDLVGILFAERTNGVTTYRDVATNEYGALENWPDNFFDQSAEETHAILTAAVKKRRQRAQEPRGRA